MNVKQRVVSVSMDSIVLTQMGLIIVLVSWINTESYLIIIIEN